MKFILGTKENMTQFFSEKGAVVPVTVLSAGPVTVTKVFEKSKDGYSSVQVGFGAGKKTKEKSKANKLYKTLKEFRLKPGDEVDVKEGDSIDVSVFAPGDSLVISSLSKGNTPKRPALGESKFPMRKRLLSSQCLRI